MNDRPSSVELLRAVERFLENDAVPSLSGPRRYHARVAANVVAIVAREIETEEDHLRGEWDRLGRLLDLDEARPRADDGLLERANARADSVPGDVVGPELAQTSPLDDRGDGCLHVAHVHTWCYGADGCLNTAALNLEHVALLLGRLRNRVGAREVVGC